MVGVLARLRRDYAGRLAVEHIDSWDRPEEARRLGVKTSPTILFYDARGRELRRMEGFVPGDRIVQVFRKLGVEL
jgi:thioredoxin 1